MGKGMAGLLKGSWGGLTTWFGGSKKRPDDRRAESRLPGHGLVRIRWADASGTIRTAKTHLINVSTSGFEVRAPQNIEIGAEIEIRDPMGATAHGLVLHSRPDDNEYLVGGTADWNEADTRREQKAPHENVNGAGG